MAIAGWMTREKQDVMEFLREENRILREKLGHKRILLNVSQKRRLRDLWSACPEVVTHHILYTQRAASR